MLLVYFDSTLGSETKITVNQTRNVNEIRLVKKMGHLSPEITSQVNRSLKLHYDLRILSESKPFSDTQIRQPTITALRKRRPEGDLSTRMPESRIECFFL